MDRGGMSMAFRTSITKSALLLTLANLTIRGVSIVFQIWLTGQVGAVGIGLLQLIMTVYGFSLTLGTSGLRVAAMYLSAEEYGLRRWDGIRQAMVWCLGAGTVLSAVVGAAMVFGAEGLSLYWIKDLRAAASLRLLGLTLPLSCVSAIFTGYFTAVGQIGRLVLVEIADRIVTAAATVWLLGLGVSSDLSHACLSVVGGGALAGLCSKLCGTRKYNQIIKLAADGEVNKCDLTVGDITRNSHPSLPLDITAANFGNVSDDATAADFAAATINMVLQTIGTTAVMACRACGCETVVLTGFMSTLPQAEECFALFTRLHGIKFVIPKDATFATSIGAALSSF